MHTSTSWVRVDSLEGSDRLIAEIEQLIRSYGAGSCEAEPARLTAGVGLADTGYAVLIEACVPDLPADQLCVAVSSDYLVIREKSRPGCTARFTALRLPVAIAPEGAAGDPMRADIANRGVEEARDVG